jgi:hypothetical protein
MFEPEQLSKERERLLKLDSLTVLDYIRTSIEILMNLKNDEEKDVKEGGRSHRFNNLRENGENGAASEFSSTF